MARKRVWAPKFLDRLRKSGSVTAAARTARVTRQAAYDMRAKDPAFAAAWDDAIEQALDDVEEAVHRRAKSKSDGLAMFLLRSRRPEVYGDKSKLEHIGDITVRVVYEDDDRGDHDPAPQAPPCPAAGHPRGSTI